MDDPYLLSAAFVSAIAGLFLFAGAETAFSTIRLSTQNAEAVPGYLLRYRSACEQPRTLYSLLAIGRILTALACAGLLISAFALCPFPLAGLEPRWCGMIAAVPVLIAVDLSARWIAHLKPMAFLAVAGPIVLFYLYFFKPFYLPLQSLLRKTVEALDETGNGNSTANGQSGEELRSIVDKGEKAGLLDKAEQTLIHRVLEFGDKRVSQIMRDRSQIFSIPLALPLPELAQRLRDAKYSRVPVYDGDDDNIVGTLYVKDVLPYLLQQTKGFSLKPLLRPPFFVPLTQDADTLFREFKQRRIHLALVVNEYGTISGLITMEDLLEELFGEIKDEHDFEEWQFDRLDDNHLLLSTALEINEFERLIGQELLLSDPNLKTVGGLVLHLFGRIPVEGEVVSFGGITFKVKEIAGTKLRKVLVSLELPVRNALETAEERS